ncbi:hypothetical protein B0H10DRAFT_2213142 [Mycena sp. CBHHK59/15]|nr:hypothetical protein B0H10DRAFT_2213142 [Mycena sp. CBHHK59/15]
MPFLERKLHKQSSELSLGETHLWFSKDAPKPNGWGLLEDITRGIPPQSILDLLRRKFPQAWLDGCQSISDPRFNDGADRLPLWTLTFWEKMAEVVKHQALWKRSTVWLDTEGAKHNGDKETKKSVEAARAVMKTMGWNTPLTCLHGTRSTVDLAAFLSNPPLDTSTEDKKFDAFPALSIAAGMQDHNFENMHAFALGVITEHLTEPGPIHHPAWALTDLLNPQTQPGAQSTSSLSSGTTSGSTNWSDAEVLLGRADWASEAEETDDEEEEGGDSNEDEDGDDDDGDEGGDAGETDGLLEHYTDMMFDGSSRMEMDEGLNDGDIDTPAADVPAPDVPAL